MYKLQIFVYNISNPIIFLLFIKQLDYKVAYPHQNTYAPFNNTKEKINTYPPLETVFKIFVQSSQKSCYDEEP